MIKKHYTDVTPTLSEKEGFKGMLQRFIWSKDDGCPHFAMRIMEFEPYGHTSYHAHLEEHQFFFLEGEPAIVDAKGNETRLKAGDSIYVPSDEPHQIKNMGKTVMKMLCMIPILPGGDGKAPAPRSNGKDYVTVEKPSAH
ncbi:MAG TPA: cupin domain-containing protein [Deltaproteobacteria bacterium]|nr:cupin domain-containing protein [Deltaproteobacteria bacterium]